MQVNMSLSLTYQIIKAKLAIVTWSMLVVV